MLNTERLCIYPASREQMEAMIASEQDAELKNRKMGFEERPCERDGPGTMKMLRQHVSGLLVPADTTEEKRRGQ